MRVNLKDAKTRNLIVVVLLAGAGLYLFFGTAYLPFAFQPTAQRIRTLRAAGPGRRRRKCRPRRGICSA